MGRPLLAGRNLATAFFVNGIIVALTVALSDLSHRQIDPHDDNPARSTAVHAAVAFAIYVVLHILFYFAVGFGKGNLASEDTIKQPSCTDFWGCPRGASWKNCYEPWYEQINGYKQVENDAIPPSANF